jgi:hypothetical protein
MVNRSVKSEERWVCRIKRLRIGSPVKERNPSKKRQPDRGYYAEWTPGQVAQSAEHAAENRGVAGSIPALATHH